MKNLLLLSICFCLLCACQTKAPISNEEQAVRDAIQQMPETKAAQLPPKMANGNDSMVVDCNHQAEILQAVFDSDQTLRKHGAGFYSDVDRENLQIVINLIEQCGMPTLKIVNQKQMTAIWLVIQHADNSYRKAYLPLLEASAEKGDLNKSNIAMMKDRILMEDNMPQLYGTQITRSPTSGDLMVYKLQDPEQVDARRKEMGLGPIEEYLSRWNLSLKKADEDHTGHEH